MLALNQLLEALREYRALEDLNCLTLPADAYFSPELHQLELEQIFRKEWLCVGREEQIPRPGDYFTTEILGEPMVIVHGSDGALRALSTFSAESFQFPCHSASYGRTWHCF